MNIYKYAILFGIYLIFLQKNAGLQSAQPYRMFNKIKPCDNLANERWLNLRLMSY